MVSIKLITTKSTHDALSAYGGIYSTLRDIETVLALTTMRKLNGHPIAVPGKPEDASVSCTWICAKSTNSAAELQVEVEIVEDQTPGKQLVMTSEERQNAVKGLGNAMMEALLTTNMPAEMSISVTVTIAAGFHRRAVHS